MKNPYYTPDIIAILVIFLLVLTGALRLIELEDPLLRALRSQVAFTIYIGLIIAWGVSLWRRMMHRRIRIYLTATVALMLLLIVTRTVKVWVLADLVPWERYAWYTYYVPILLIPLFAFWAALCMGRPEDDRPELLYRLLLVPTLLLLIGILTNEFHHLAFSFSPEQWLENEIYSYEVLHFITIGWILALTLSAIWQFYKKSWIPGTEKRIRHPMMAVGVSVVYCILYALYPSKSGFGFFEAAVLICVITAGIWESCIYSGLIPVNTHYQAFFTCSTLAAQIIDQSGQILFKSGTASSVDEKTFALLKKEQAVQRDDNIQLHLSPIRGGYVIWQEDISQISRLIDQLQETREELQGRADFLKDEYKFKAKESGIRERIRLYHLLIRETKPQLEKIKTKLAKIPIAGEDDQRRLLSEINIIGTYIKRRCNLVLMAEGDESVTGETLRQCLNESAENLRLHGVLPSLRIETKHVLDCDCAMLCYDIFEVVAEASLNEMKEISASLTVENAETVFTVQIRSGKNLCRLPWRKWRTKELKSLDAILSCRQHGDDTFSLTLRLRKAGEQG
jgi:hypothetical protein